MSSNPIVEATAETYRVLEPLTPEQRLKVVDAALVLLGQPRSGGGGIARAEVGADSLRDVPPAPEGVHASAARWLKQHGITAEMVEQCFHLEPDPPEVVGTVPGSSGREMTENCYLLTGIAALLKGGDASFDDARARGLCENSGCYDPNNHAKYMKLGNKMGGEKKKGWKLLAPGLKAGADVVKAMSSSSSG